MDGGATQLHVTQTERSLAMQGSCSGCLSTIRFTALVIEGRMKRLYSPT